MNAYKVTFKYANYGDGDGGAVVILGETMKEALALLPEKDSGGNPQHEGIKSIECVGPVFSETRNERNNEVPPQ